MMVLMIFVVTLCVALMLLSTALVLLLTELVGSILTALIIVGVAMLIIASIIYVSSLRGYMLRLQQRIEIICDISAIIATLYQRATSLIATISKLWR